MIELTLFFATLLLAFANGANDNFKGFATVWGSQTLTYRRALWFSSAATLLGSVVSLMLAQALLKTFSGKGLVPDATIAIPAFAPSVALASALAVLSATRLGLPVSTTHAMLGALLGAGFAVASANVHVSHLLSVFLLPLLASPIIAGMLAWAIAYRQRRSPPAIESCVCVVGTAPSLATANVTPFGVEPTSNVIIAPVAECQSATPLIEVKSSTISDGLHVLSAASICFARGVNDTPKLAALLLMAQMSNVSNAVAMIAIAMLIGGFLFSKRVATTMSQRLSTLDHRSGLTANLITTTLVLMASKWGLPVSTTHVAVGAIAGVGQGAQTVDRRVLRNILLSWLATLPLALMLAYLLMFVLY